MLFDEPRFVATVNELTEAGRLDDLERYLLDELTRIRDDGLVTDGTSFCCHCGGKSPETIRGDEDACKENRFDGMIVCASELADLYRRRAEFAKCFDMYKELIGYVGEAGLVSTPTHARILVNEAYARIDAKDFERASNIIDVAEKVAAEVGDGMDAESLSRMYDAKAIAHLSQGDAEGASEASQQALDAIVGGASSPSEFVSMVLNHAATLAQLGAVKDALSAIDELLASNPIAQAGGEALYQALNLRATILYRSGEFREAAETLASLIARAREDGDLSAELPTICMNCSQMYLRAGDKDAAESFRTFATGE